MFPIGAQPGSLTESSRGCGQSFGMVLVKEVIMLAPKPNAHCSLKDKNKDERTKHSTGLSFRNLQGQQRAQACSQKRLFYGSELKVEWATPEVVSFPSQGVFKQIFPIPRFDPVSLFPGVSGLSRPHTPPCSTSIYPTHWTVLPSSDLSAFNHTAPLLKCP